MKPAISIATLLAVSTVVFIVSPGCEDSGAKQRDAIQRELLKVSSDFQVALARGGEGDLNRFEEELNGILNALAGIDGGEEGQQAAKSLLSANALRELAAVQTAHALALEDAHRQQREVIEGKLAAARQLDAIASGIEAIDAQTQRDELQQQLAASRERVNQLTQEVTQLTQPISEQTALNEQQLQEVNTLQTEVGELMRRAQQQGVSAGFDTFRRSKDMERQADKLEYQISQRDIALDYELKPERQLAQVKLDQLQALIAAIEQTQNSLATFSQAASGDVTATRERITAIGTEISVTLREMEGEMAGDLSAAYDQAFQSLEKAAAAAQAAGRGGSGSAASIVAARINEAAARLHATRARALADHRATLEHVAAVPSLGEAANVGGSLSALNSQYEQEIEAAKAAAAAATENLGAVQGGPSQNEVERFRTDLDNLTATLEGRAPLAPPPVTPEMAPPASEEAAAPADVRIGGVGAESPEALAAALQGIDTVGEMSQIFDLMPPLDDSVSATLRESLPHVKVMMDGMAALDQALQAKFSKSVREAGPGEMPTITGARLDGVEGDAGTITVTMEDGTEKALTIAQIDGRWYLGAPDDRTGAIQAIIEMENEAELQAMSEFFPPMTKVVTDLAQAVQAGEFETFEAFNAEFQNRIMAVSMPGLEGVMNRGGAVSGGAVEPDK